MKKALFVKCKLYNVKWKFTSIFLSFSFFFIVSCYSHVGSSLSPEVKTANIATIANLTPFNPRLSQDFTIALQDRFDQRTQLSLVNSADAHIKIEGEITSFNYAPTSITSTNGTESGSQNRLTINVTIRYENKIDPDKSFDKTFSDFADASANLSIEEAQGQLLDEITKRLIDQIFNAIVADW